METDNLYPEIYHIGNLILAWRKARQHKTKKYYVIEFERDTLGNLLKLQEELKNQTYKPEPLKTFILRDPKTRKISVSAFRDRIVHHALVRIIEPIFDKSFVYDSCANRIGKGNLFAIHRFEIFKRKITHNLKTETFCLKADVKHYFQEVNHRILIEIIKRRIRDKKVIWLVERILANLPFSEQASASSCKFGQIGGERSYKGMPLGNLTSQFFANVYLHELDHFIKHKLKAKYYIRYVDDFIILHNSKSQLEIWKQEVSRFLKDKLKLELHPQKSRIISLSKGVDFVGFRIFWHHKSLRKRNIRKMLIKIDDCKKGEISKEELLMNFQGWNAYAKWADTLNLRRSIVQKIYSKNKNRKA